MSHRAQRAEHQTLAADAAEVLHQIAPDDLGLERIAADQPRRDVLFDHDLGGFSAHLVVGYAKAGQSLIGRQLDDGEPDAFHFSCRITEVQPDRAGHQKNLYLCDPMFLHSAFPSLL